MHSELLTHPDIYSKSFPTFGRRTIVGYIGLENLMYARTVENKTVCFDLNLHIQRAIRKDHGLDVKLNDLLQFLVEQERRLNFETDNLIYNAKVFCYRGLLTCVARTPYENKDPWNIVSILYKGNIYLCVRHTEEKMYQKCNMTDQEKKFTSWGYKFEQYMLSENPTKSPNPDEPLDENKEFSLVFKTNLNKHSIVYGAEMDGIRCDKTLVSPAPTDKNPDLVIEYLTDKEFIELKTSRHIQFSKQKYNFERFKTIKWWCQSFLVGIDKIVCGFRDDDGIVEELKVYSVRDLAKMSKRFWKPNVCLNFLDTFLTFVKNCLAKEIKRKNGEKAVNNITALPMIALLFEWTPGMPVRVSENYAYEDDPILTEYFVQNYGRKVDL